MMVWGLPGSVGEPATVLGAVAGGDDRAGAAAAPHPARDDGSEARPPAAEPAEDGA